MYTRRITMIVICGLLISVEPVWGDGLTIVLSTDKGTYEFAEPITFTVTVTNTGAKTYVLATPPFHTPAYAFLQMKSPRGRPVRSARRYGMRFRDVRPPTISLDPGQSYTVSVNLRDHYIPYSPTTGGSAKSLDEPGTYEMFARYHIDSAQHWPDVYEGIFVGPVESEPIRFTVKPLAGPRLAQVLEQLNDEDVDAKCEAIDLLRRGQAVQHAPDGLLAGFLRMDQPLALRRCTARAIMQFPNPESWRTYVEYLGDSDRNIRNGMAGALRRIGNKAACDALYAVTDPEKYPGSYTSAFQALVELGDPRVPELAARLAESAPEEWMRDIARKTLEDLARPKDE